MNLKKRVEKLENEMNNSIIEYELKWDEQRKNVSEWNDEDLKT